MFMLGLGCGFVLGVVGLVAVGSLFSESKEWEMARKADTSPPAFRRDAFAIVAIMNNRKVDEIIAWYEWEKKRRQDDAE